MVFFCVVISKGDYPLEKVTKLDTLYPYIWNWQNPKFLAEELRDIMDFRLIYDGQLLSQSNSKRVANKNEIRKQIHDQLFELWDKHRSCRDENV